jgi:hypothetical protein
MDKSTVEVSSHKLHYGNPMAFFDHISDGIGMQRCEDTGANISKHFTNVTVSDIAILYILAYQAENIRSHRPHISL